MSSHLTVNEAVELLANLKGAAQDFAAREEKLERDYRTRMAGLEKRFEETLETLAQESAARIADADAASQQERTRLQSRRDRRKDLINRAHQSSTRLVLDRIEGDEGHGKYASQKGLLDTERGRQERRAQNDAALADFNGQLSENREEFVRLEREAQKAFRGYRSFGRRLTNPAGIAAPDLDPDEHQLLERLRQLQARTSADLARFRKIVVPSVFRYLPPGKWILLILACVGGLVPILRYFGVETATYAHMAVAGPVALALVLGLYFVGKRQANPIAATIAQSLEEARRLHNACLEKAQARHAREIQRIETEAGDQARMLNENWQKTLDQAAERRALWPGRIDEKWRRASARNERLHQNRIGQVERHHAAIVEQLTRDGDTRRRELTEAQQARLGKLNAEHEAHWQKLESEWRQLVPPMFARIEAATAAAEREFPAWQASLWDHWTPPAVFRNVVKFGRLEIDWRKLCEALPRDSRLAFPGPTGGSLPLLLAYPIQGSILFETTKPGNEPVIAALNNLIFRLLATSPAGKSSFTIIDPIKLGQNFAGVMHLADYEENLINSRILTQAGQIEERLADLNEHMEKVIQMYLRNEYETIAEYNLQAGNIAEKYHFVVIADFPANFSEGAIRRLLHIAASGARCGVYTLIHWDHRHPAPPDFFPEELRKSSVCLNGAGEHFALAHPFVPGTRVIPDAPPDPDFATRFLHQVGEASRGSNRVEVPFTQVAPAETARWSLDTTEELRVPIGRSGATKLQYLAIGKGTRQHALFAGKTGSGKSTLFHVIITNLALWCSPEQVEFYLVDFKKGVEFKCYASRRLPHARVVAIESDREFGLSVLQRVDEELRRRGDLFRQLGVQDIPGYKRAGGTEAMPRSLLLIDEFQEFFVEDDKISQAAAVLLDRIVRQGRAFGIHVLLGSQTLGGAYTLARTTIGQMVIRVALQCNEADAYLIMDENNAAPRLLSRPGEGIYNDMAGMMEGNSPFQAVWLPDDEREACLEQVRSLADQTSAAYPGPIVFEGNAPADVRENHLLRAVLESESIKPAPAARLWLGAPNSIKGPTEAVFQRRSGNHLLVVGQREEAILAIVSVGLIALAAQHPTGSARFVVLESAAPESPERAFLERIVRLIPHQVTLAKGADLTGLLSGLSDDLKQRTDDEHGTAPATFVFIHGLQNFKKLRQEDEFSFSMDDTDKAGNAAAQLLKLVNEGASHGIHLVATLDTYNNVNRFLGRKALSEFEMRVLFQMSTNDSASLCDDPKASTLGLHRALFYNEQEGYLETFRPYALPAGEWIEYAARHLARLVK